MQKPEQVPAGTEAGAMAPAAALDRPEWDVLVDSFPDTSDIEQLRKIERGLREEMAAIEAVNRVGQMLSTKLKMDDLARSFIDTATKISGAQSGVFFFPQSGQGGEAAALYHFPERAAGRAEKADVAGLMAVCAPELQENRTIRVENAPRDPSYKKVLRQLENLQGQAVTSFLAVPIVSGSGRLSGGAFFAHEQEGVFTRQKERVMLCLAAQVAIAVENAHLYDQAQEAKRNLEKSYHRLELAQKAGRLGAFEWDVDENRMQWSKELEELYGIRPGSFPGSPQDWARLAAAEDRERLEAEVLRASAEKKDLELEFRIRAPGQGLRWLLAKAHAFQNPFRFVGIQMDITLRKQAEEVLRENEKKQKEFVANVSHEFRTPLATIKGLAETLKLGGLDDRRHRMSFLNTIIKHTDRLERLVEELLTLSTLESGARVARPESLSLASFTRKFVQAIAFLAEKNKVTIRTRIPPEIRVRADRQQLSQVLQNLLANAIKFNRKGGWIEIHGQAVGGQAVVSVRDGGIGIPGPELPHIFDRFYRVDKSDSRKLGTGLGLAIVKHIVESYGGDLWAESEQGKGATFRFTVPLDPPSPRPPAA